MNSESESMNNFHPWSFNHFAGLNGSLFSGASFPFQGVNPAAFSLNPSYLQLANALQWPVMLPRSNSFDNVLVSHHDTPLSSFKKDNIESIPSSNATEQLRMQSPEGGENMMTSMPNKTAPEGLQTSNSSKNGFSTSDSQINHSEDRFENSSNILNESQERPFLKFGVQAILSQVSPVSTGKNYSVC